MVLRERSLASKNGSSSMIVAVSLTSSQYSATLNSLKYGSLRVVGAAGLRGSVNSIAHYLSTWDEFGHSQIDYYRRLKLSLILS